MSHVQLSVNISNCCCYCRSAALLGIERLLMVAERYVVSVEEFFGGCRSLPPHGATFWGQSFKLRVACDNTKNEFCVLVGCLVVNIFGYLRLYLFILMLIICKKFILK